MGGAAGKKRENGVFEMNSLCRSVLSKLSIWEDTLVAEASEFVFKDRSTYSSRKLMLDLDVFVEF